MILRNRSVLFGLALNSFLIEPWFTSPDLRRPFFADGMKTEISSHSEIEPSLRLKGRLFILRSAQMLFFQFRNPFVPIGELPPETSYIKGFPHQLRQGENRHNSPPNQRRIKDQSCKRHLKFPSDEFQLQRHAIL